jgi:predicted Mrr-cat superfamily restriction endonuclease
MPQRTNDFQSLMYLIQSRLAPTSARVEESAYLTDKAIDSDREIDILITDPRGNLPPQTIAIECRDRKRKADVEWIDAIIGKYSKIGVRRVVAISRSGFTKNAIKKAKDANIDTLSLGQALEADWETAVKNVIAAMLRSHLQPISKPSWSVIILGDTQREETP